MRDLANAIATVRALLGDPLGQWVTREYILPLMNISYASVNLNLANASSRNLEAVIPVLGVPAGTTSLYPWQSGTGLPGAPAGAAAPLALLKGLTDPIEVWVKPAGSPVSMYSRARERGTLPHVDSTQYATNSLAGGLYFNWLGGKLLITPVNQPLDIEVTGKFAPPPLVDDTDLLATHEDVWVPTCFDTAAVAGVERSNPALLTGYAQKSTAAQDNIVAALIRQGQATPSRFQRISRATGLAQWFWN